MSLRLRKNHLYYFLFQLFWILALLPKYVQFGIIILLVIALRFPLKKNLKIDGFEAWQMLALGVYFLAIIVNLVLEKHQISRIAAAFNTSLITLAAIVLYDIYKNTQIDVEKLSKYCFWNMVFLEVLCIFYKIAGSRFSLGILGHALSGADWVDGFYTTRFLGYLDYANMVVFFVLINFPLSLYYLCRKGDYIPVNLVYAVLAFWAVKETNSRSGILLVLVVVGVYLVVKYWRNILSLYKRNRIGCIIVCLMIALAGMYFLRDYLNRIYERLMGMRTGSNGMRSYIYSTSLKRMWENSPIIGMGIKDMLNEGYPYGSHSSYVGYFYKTGILGGIIYLCSYFCLVWKVMKLKAVSASLFCYKICVYAILILMVVEDIDGTNWCICMFYASLAILQNISAKKQSVNGEFKNARSRDFCDNNSI